MKAPVKCMYCRKQYGEIELGEMDTKSMLAGKPVESTGICPACYPIMEAQVIALENKNKENK